ncbi:MAG TPA: hypothetical protein VFA05_01705 [Gaiellaceae bacterium]|nr:hypothetical protein [Gaiellaceae bacterium]
MDKDNPPATEREQELAQTGRQGEEEDMRGTTSPDDADNLPSDEE